jgi:copper chaperone CopZ
MEELVLIIPSIGCQGCMKKIVSKLQTLASVEVVHTDVSTKSLLVHYLPREISEEEIKSVIRAIGHKLAPAPSELTTSQA